MASAGRNSKDLIDAANRLSTQMAQRYMNIVRLAKLPATEGDGVARNEVAVNALSMDVEVTSLRTTAEELLSLTRRLKEMWLFGQLDTLRQSDAAPGEEGESDAMAVARMLADQLERESKQDG